MSPEKDWLWKRGEEAAAVFLQDRGYRILQRNFRTRVGEIDIVARKNGVVCFIEVKSRSTLDRGLPAESVTSLKQIKLSKMALYFLKEQGLLNSPARFDVVCVTQDARGTLNIRLIPNAFDAKLA